MRVMAPDRGILKLAVRVLITVLVGGCAPQISGSDSDDADLASAGRYDGRWFAVVPAQGGCNFSSQLTIDVHGRFITGAAINPQGRFPLNGTIHQTGDCNFRIGDFPGTIRFSNDRFTAEYANNCGVRHAEGSKVTSSSAGRSL